MQKMPAQKQAEQASPCRRIHGYMQVRLLHSDFSSAYFLRMHLAIPLSFERTWNTFRRFQPCAVSAGLRPYTGKLPHLHSPTIAPSPRQQNLVRRLLLHLHRHNDVAILLVKAKQVPIGEQSQTAILWISHLGGLGPFRRGRNRKLRCASVHPDAHALHDDLAFPSGFYRYLDI